MIKFLSSHVDLNTGENKHTMVVGRVDQQEGLEVDLDPITYMQLGQVAQQLIGQGPQQSSGVFAPTGEDRPTTVPPDANLQPPASAESNLEAQLRALELESYQVPGNGGQSPASPDDLLRQVGWFDQEEAEPPKDALADLVEEVSDPGEDYPEDDGVESV